MFNQNSSYYMKIFWFTTKEIKLGKNICDKNMQNCGTTLTRAYRN